jgi:hypothetical protein
MKFYTLVEECRLTPDKIIFSSTSKEKVGELAATKASQAMRRSYTSHLYSYRIDVYDATKQNDEGCLEDRLNVAMGLNQAFNDSTPKPPVTKKDYASKNLLSKSDFVFKRIATGLYKIIENRLGTVGALYTTEQMVEKINESSRRRRYTVVALDEKRVLDTNINLFK